MVVVVVVVFVVVVVVCWSGAESGSILNKEYINIIFHVDMYTRKIPSE